MLFKYFRPSGRKSVFHEHRVLYHSSSYIIITTEDCAMKAIVKQIQGCAFIGKSDSNHWVAVDNKKEFGPDAAAHPMELVLIALGSCSGCDVISILQKKQVPLNGFEVHIEADRTETYPKAFTKIHLTYVFYGKGLNPVHLRRAIDLSQEKYCPVSAMLKPSVPITTSFTIVEQDVGV
jgi:putative redox protein